jgi:hypothetical protein
MIKPFSLTRLITRVCVAALLATTPVVLATVFRLVTAAPHVANAASIACPASNFIAVTAHPKNSAYPAPSLSVSCTTTTFVILSNGIPTFEFVQLTPNALRAQSYRWELPLTATAGVSRSVPLGGAAAIAVDGLPIFGPTEAPRDGYRDPVLDNILDYCNGHTAPAGDYHFHARPDCLLGTVGSAPGTILGYGMDGVPILSPFVCADATCATTRKVTSGWTVVNAAVQNAWQRHGYTNSGDLDVCNGGLTSDGSYAYFATDSFPYFLGCYRGTVPANTPSFRTRADTTPTATITLTRRAYLPYTRR